MAAVAFRLSGLAALLVALPLARAAPAVTFAVIGDWGWGPDGDYYRSNDNRTEDFAGQKAVAKVLGEYCAEVKCEFVINTGDNFYNLGIDRDLGVFDPQWTTTFNNLYSAPSLKKIKFYGVLGNHDYGVDSPKHNHSIWPQITYTAYDPLERWTIPQRYYYVIPPKTKFPVQITTVDTSPFLDSYCTDPTGKYYSYDLRVHCEQTQREGDQAHMIRKLTDAKKARAWNIAVGHHPLISAADGPYEPLYSTYAPILNAGGPQLWFNGHDHITAHHLIPGVPNTDFFTIGASGVAEAADLPSPGDINHQSGPYVYASANHAFAIVKLFKTYGEIYIYGVTNFYDLSKLQVKCQYFYKFSK